MNYTLLTIKCGSHLLYNALMKSVKEHLPAPSEIIVKDYHWRYSKQAKTPGEGWDQGIKEAQNELVVVCDDDVIFHDSVLVNSLLHKMESNPNILVASADSYPFNGRVLPVSGVMCIRKSLYEKGIPFDSSGNPCYNTFVNAEDVLKQELLVLNMPKSWTHLHCGSTYLYSQILDEDFHIYPRWKEYMVDDGLDMSDMEDLTCRILREIETAIKYRISWSNIRLGDLGMRYLEDYFFNEKDFTHVGQKHPDLAIMNDEIGRKMIEELIRHMKNANWVDHIKLYKGVLNDLYEWRGSCQRTDTTYKTAGIINKNYCSSVQNYLMFIEEFERNLYQSLEGRKVLYVGPHDELIKVMERANCKPSQYGYYQLSMGSPEERYQVMNDFSKFYKKEYWDLVCVTGSLYGRLIIGRVKEMGGRAVDLGQSVGFCPNNIFEGCFSVNENKTFYRIKNHYTKG